MAHRSTDVHARFVQLLAQIKAAQHSGDSRAALSQSLELARLLHHSGPATERVALAYAELGERRRALAWLRQFTAMGQSDDSLPRRPQLERMRSLPQLERIISAMRRNESAIDGAAMAIRLRDAALLPEDIDYDAATQSYLITSVLRKEIVRVSPGGTQKVVFRSPDHWPMLAIRIDGRRGIVWSTEVAMTGFTGAPRKDWDRSALLCLRLSDGTLIRKVEVPRTSLGDMALMPNGDVIVSDGENGGVYRARAGCTDVTLQRVDSGQFISPQTPAPLPDGKHVFVPDYARGIALLDVDTGRAHWLDAGGRHTLHGIDGMYLVSGGLLCIRNGATPERLVFFRLDDRLQIIDEKVVDRSTPTLGDPTHGVVVGDEFYYIANSGWNSLDDQGRIKSGASMTPPNIKRLSIPAADAAHRPISGDWGRSRNPRRGTCHRTPEPRRAPPRAPPVTDRKAKAFTTRSPTLPDLASEA